MKEKMKEKLLVRIKNIFTIGKYIFNMSLLTFTLVFACAYYVYNPIVLMISGFGLILTIILNQLTNKKLDIWLFIRGFCLVKLLFLFIYLKSDFMLCVNDVNKAVVDTTVSIGNNFNINSQVSLNCLESVGAVTLFFGSMYVTHRLLNSYISKPGSEAGSGPGTNSSIVNQPIFSEGPVRVDRSTSTSFSEAGFVSNSPIVSQPIFSEGPVCVDRSTSPVPSEFFESALSGPRSTSPSLSEASELAIVQGYSPSIRSGCIGLVDRNPSPEVSFRLEDLNISLYPERSLSSVSNSSHSSPYPDTLSAPGLETIRTEDSIVSWNSFSRSSSSSLVNSVEDKEVITINFNTIYNNLPIINFGVESYAGNNLAKDHPNVGSSAFLENPDLKDIIDNLIPKDFREFGVMQNGALQTYLEDVYKIGFCIQALIQNIDNDNYFTKESLLTDLANTYRLIHRTFENQNIQVLYSCSDIIHKLLPKVKNFIIEENEQFKEPIEIALVEYEHFECLYKGLYYYSNNNMPLSPFQYHKYSEALNFVNGVIKKDRNYTELVTKVTDRDLTILELTFKNFELSGLSISNCLSVFKVAAYCLFNVNLGPIDDIDTVVEKFLSHKKINMLNNVTIKTDEAFEEINNNAVYKENYYKIQVADSKPFDLIGEIIDKDIEDSYYNLYNKNEENVNEEKVNEEKYDDEFNDNYENNEDENYDHEYNDDDDNYENDDDENDN